MSLVSHAIVTVVTFRESSALEFSGANLEQCDDALGVQLEAVGNEVVTGAKFL